MYKVVHLEPTDVCQAACPLCARELDPAFDKSLRHHLTIQQVQQHVSDKDIAKLDKMFMCGNYGDPAAGLHTLRLYRYFRDINPAITLGMNSNGAIQNISWWSELASILNQPKDYVVYSIDGLQDTNHIYRKHVSWRKLMDNAETFINAGGHAHWDMLVYKHNEHQVDACEQLARDMGFKWFRAKVSKREYINGLQEPTSWQRPTFTVGQIDCHALAEQSIYIDAQGRKSPCCWLGARQHDFVTDIAEVATTWGTDSPEPVCAVTCTTKENITIFESQWQREVELC